MSLESFDKKNKKPFLLSQAIKGEFFQNRAALKMAELDAVFGFMFTQPKGLNPEKELLWFADLCAGK